MPLPPLPRLAVEPVALALGMERAGRTRLGPCPACHEDRGKHDSRPPVTLRGDAADRWWCSLCRVAGDAYDLVAYRLLGRRAREAGSEFSRVLDWLRDRGDVPVIEPRAPRPPTYPPLQGVLEALRRATPLAETLDPEVLAFLARRNLSTSAPAGVLPAGFAARPWWPAGRSGRWPLVVPAVDASGAIRSLHARRLDGERPKSLWPKEADAVALVFADPRHARPWLQGGRTPSRVLIVEGMTDYLRACGEPGARGWAVLGIESGSASAFARMPWRPEQRVYVCTDGDAPGDAYAAALERAVPVSTRRVPMLRGMDLCDVLDADGTFAGLIAAADAERVAA